MLYVFCADCGTTEAKEDGKATHNFTSVNHCPDCLKLKINNFCLDMLVGDSVKITLSNGVIFQGRVLAVLNNSQIFINSKDNHVEMCRIEDVKLIQNI